MKETDVLLTYSFNAPEIKLLYRLFANREMPEPLKKFSSQVVAALYSYMTIEEAESFFNE
jgi:hypothetical protein